MSDSQIFNSRGRKISRSGGLERRRQILVATQRIIIRDGMRGVRHRAVAKEADVPLAATTYYFKGIEDLITAAFTYWAERSATHSIKFRETCYSIVSTLNECQLQDSQQRLQLAEAIAAITVNHVMEQNVLRHDDRVLELAFHHEALRNEKLKQLVLNQQSAYLRDLETFHRKIDGNDPRADAQISLSIVYRLQHEAVMLGLQEMRQTLIEQTVRRHVFGVFSVDDPRLGIGCGDLQASRPTVGPSHSIDEFSE